MKIKRVLILCWLSLFIFLFTVYIVQASDKPTITSPIPVASPTANTSTSKEVVRDGQYIKYDNGLVLDMKTNLEWYAGMGKNSNWDEAKAWVERLKVAEGEWRMPTIDELRGLYQKGKGNHNITPLLIKGEKGVLEQILPWSVWSAEKCSLGARFFDFKIGNSNCDFNISWRRKAFAVRSRKVEKLSSPLASSRNQASGTICDGQYVKYANGVVLDTQTNLEWYVGPDKDTDWEGAKSWVASLTVAGGRWRMPSMVELNGLYQSGKGSRNMTPLLSTTGWWVWSGEECSTSFVRSFFFIYSGFDNCGGRSYSLDGRAFAVRSRR